MLVYTGRKKIFTDVDVITRDNVADVLFKALGLHWANRAQISYLYEYYKGNQPILNRVKEVRPEINNKIVENRANEIVSFKVGYLMGEPIQYVSRGDDNETLTKKLDLFNLYMFAEDKAAKDKALADWMHICGTSFRMVLPASFEGEEPDEAPFEIFTLDPRCTFVVYHNSLGEKPAMAVMMIERSDGTLYSVYTEDRYFLIQDTNEIVEEREQVFGIPIIEYPLNNARLGAFEIVLSLLDAINTIESNRVDAVEQFVQALMLFHNVDISVDDFDKLRQFGALKFKDADPQLRAEISYLVEELKQQDTQTLIDYLYDTVLTICGMPNRNGGSSTSDTGKAVIYRDGWSSAEARAKDTEIMFKRSEKTFLKLALRICRDLTNLDLRLFDIDIRFTRRNYENTSEKASVLIAMLNNNKIAPSLAFQHCGMFADPEVAYLMSKKYAEEQVEKELARLTKVAGVKEKEEEGDDVQAA